MTTIACDGKTVVADGQMTAGSEILDLTKKKLRVSGAGILGFTGTSALQNVIFDWFENGSDPSKIDGAMKEMDWTLAVFKVDAAYYYKNNCPYPISMPYPIAFGNGQELATGAMLAGASARRALEIACARDIMTGGEILELPLEGNIVNLILNEAAE